MKRWVGVVLALVASTPVARGQARLGLFVVDANGQKVGYYTPVGASNFVVNGIAYAGATFFLSGTAYAVAVGKAGFIVGPEGWLSYHYPTPDCSGAAYFVYAPATDDFVTVVNFTTDGVFHYSSTAPPVMFTAESQQSIKPDGSLGPCQVAADTRNFSLPVTLPAPSFLPPFQLVDALQVSPAPTHATFNDVPTTDWAFRFIEALAKSGITSGCQASPPLYCPDNKITRREMAVFLAVALGL
jgi:hypothetical protein